MENKSTLTIQTTDGPIKGYIETQDEIVSYKFKKIPYAMPPIGRLRFMPPCPIKPWTEEIDCTQPAPAPLQYMYNNTKEIIGSEDSLYIEISTPNTKPERLMPVMFWIGSVAFSFTMESIYNPLFINQQDVVFVKCGFRIGPFGFLSIKSFTSPGNCGLKDIVLALKWVQTNIKHFGGDPTNVTMFGNSSGGAIVHLMVLSPLTRGLFHKAIIQSASALNNWAVNKNPLQAVMELAHELNITKTDYEDIVEELRLLPAEDILTAFAKIVNLAEYKEITIFGTLFKPCIEEEFEGQPAFLTKSPYLIMKSGNFNKVPMIIGCNNIEAELLNFLYKNFYDTKYEMINEDVNYLVPKSLGGDFKLNNSIGQQILNFYFLGEEVLSKRNETQYLQLISDYHLLYYMNKTIRLLSRTAPDCPIYYYIVNYAGEWFVPDDLKFFNCLGHTAETPFIFGIQTTNTSLYKGSRDSIRTRSRVIKMWTNFAKYGNPTPDENDPILQIKWEAVENEHKLNYLSIGSELTKGRNPFQERMNFWDDLHREHTFLRALVYFNDLRVSW